MHRVASRQRHRASEVQDVGVVDGRDGQVVQRHRRPGDAVREILLSQDVCWKSHLRMYGGSGYTYIQETFLPYLASLGVSDEVQHQIMVENPRRVLTLVSPA